MERMTDSPVNPAGEARPEGPAVGSEIFRAFVAGAGQMGAGIAQVLGQAGLSVYLYDLNQELAQRGYEVIHRNLARSVAKGRLREEERQAALGRIRAVCDLSEAAQADLVVEAIAEDLQAKAELFRRLDQLAPPQVIFASNTSSLSITRLAASTRRPERFVGLHFMNPVPVMSLVEVIRGQLTSPETFRTAWGLVVRLGKTPVEVQDYPGFVANRVLIPMINEAIFCVMEGVAKPEDVDTVLKLGANHPMGPLQLADFIGLDTCLAILDVMYRDLGDPKYRAAPLLRRMVQAGLLGRKSGRGFYQYA